MSLPEHLDRSTGTTAAPGTRTKIGVEPNHAGARLRTQCRPADADAPDIIIGGRHVGESTMNIVDAHKLRRRKTVPLGLGNRRLFSCRLFDRVAMPAPLTCVPISL